MVHLKDKRVLVTGCCGTVGGELVRQLLADYSVKELVGLDNNESELFFTQQRYNEYPAHFFLADVRDPQRLMRLFSGVDIVFHAAAFKHVILCEISPFEAVQTNINGVQNVILAATENRVKTVVFTSSDKAVNPTNVMGTSKLMGERLMTAANSNLRAGGSAFISTRFGNVLGSRGSVIPIFREQIRKGGPVTITDEKMTRFIMSIRQAVQLVIDSVGLARGGEVFVTKMPVIRIVDLAHVIGSKAGEKQYEELMTGEEVRRCVELERYFVVKPAFTSLYRDVTYSYPEVVNGVVDRPYHSANEPALDRDSLRRFLIDNELLEGEEEDSFQPDKRY